MSQQSYCDCSNQGSKSESEELKAALLAGGKGLLDLSLLKFLEFSSRPEGSSSTIGIGGVGSADVSALVDIEPSDFSVMDAATLLSRGWGSPSGNLEHIRFNGQRPTGIDQKNVTPTDRVLVKRIDDDHSLIAENYFGANQVEVDTNERKERNQSASNFGSGARVVEIRPGKKSADYYTENSEVEVGSRAEDLLVIHSTILSQITTITSDTIKAVS